jgi:hypothetical protein
LRQWAHPPVGVIAGLIGEGSLMKPSKIKLKIKLKIYNKSAS